MNSRQALDYLYAVTVIEPTVADERAEAAIDVLRIRLVLLEAMIALVLDEGTGDELRAVLEDVIGEGVK